MTRALLMISIAFKWFGAIYKVGLQIFFITGYCPRSHWRYYKKYCPFTITFLKSQKLWILNWPRGFTKYIMEVLHKETGNYTKFLRHKIKKSELNSQERRWRKSSRSWQAAWMGRQDWESGWNRSCAWRRSRKQFHYGGRRKPRLFGLFPGLLEYGVGKIRGGCWLGRKRD